MKKFTGIIIFSLFIFLLHPQGRENFFWDSLSDFSNQNAYFPVALNDSHNAYVFWESVNKAGHEIKISWRKKSDSLDWSDIYTLDDTFVYSGDEVPDIYSAAISENGTLVVSVLDSSAANGGVKIYSLSSEDLYFKNYAFPPQKKQTASSRVFSYGDNDFILFISLGEGKLSPTESSFSLLYSQSHGGKNWTSLKPFTPSASISNAFSPFFAQIGDKDFVFFEGRKGKDSTTSLIYGTSRLSKNNSDDWSEAFVVTDESSVPESSVSYQELKNFRPYVLASGFNAKMVWERTTKTGGTASVMVAGLDSQGRIIDKNDVEALNSFGNARRPSLFIFRDKFFAMWFDDRNGINKVHLAENLGVQWVEVDSFSRRLANKDSLSFPCSLILPDNKALMILWQADNKRSTSISMLSEDFYAKMPSFEPKNFIQGKRSDKKNPAVKVILPPDISGLSGWSGIWTDDKNMEPEKSTLSKNYHSVSDNLITAKISDSQKEDKILYFKACLLDKAGNWSDVQTLEYYYDCTPPKKLSEINFEKDEWGFALSNDVTFSWESDESDDIAGFSFALSKVSPLDRKFWVTKNKKLDFSPEESSKVLEGLIEKNSRNILNIKNPPAKVKSAATKALFKNRDNGIYVFSVRPVDTAGNAGESLSQVVFLNKYKAATLIKNVKAAPDDLGNVSLDITGEEFSYDGEISQVIITRKETGEKYVFSKGSDFTVKKGKNSQETISGIKIDGMKAGSYTVQVKHSERGLASWKKSLVIEENGTVKYEKQYNFEPVWTVLNQKQLKYSIKTDTLIFWSVIFLVVCGILVSSRGIILVVRDAVKIRKEVSLILTGDYMAKEEIEEMEAKLHVQVSLRLKFGLSITTLLLFIVVGVAFAIGYQMSKTQEKILIEGLKNRVKVVMGNMSSGVQTYLDDGRDRLVEIGSIVNQTDNFEEARCATILSYEIDGKTLNDGSRPLDYVWATNDEDIVRKINAVSFDAGTVRFESADKSFNERCSHWNRAASEIVENLSHTTGDNSNLIFKKLNEYSSLQYTSYPLMSDEKLDRHVTEYYFYWPVIYQKAQNNETFLQSIILMEVSTDTLIRQIDSSRLLVMSIALFASIVAAIIGLISAFSLSSIIVSPIRRIVAHVKKITETKDKLLLEGVEIKITSHDELRTLGDSVNEMTKGLVKGARDEERAKIAFQRAAVEREKAARAQALEAKARAEAAEMSIMNLDGQAVQKAFIPLVSEGNEKETTASYKDNSIELFGYYEGTDAVSGDYFDYKKLDDRWYALIKCDASGHGVPAALIMTIVATIFRRYFAGWKFEKQGVKLNLLASDINDFIESLGLRGKFAAMMICLLDTKTGELYTCNAGDNILHVFDALEKKIKVMTLHEAPAAGPLPSFMVDMKGGYKVEKIKLKKDDVLFLYTDGIEESTRFFRNSDFEIISCEEEELKEGEIHETHKKGEKSEQMEPVRVQKIIESVLNKQKYELKRYHSPVENEKLEFDFTKCQGTIEEAIIALTAVEKVFRMYRKNNSEGKVEKTEMDLDGKRKTVIQVSGDGIKIDRKIDAFLKKYFNLYDYYCINKVDEGETNYVYYTGVSEDVQADDLTLLAIKKI